MQKDDTSRKQAKKYNEITCAEHLVALFAIQELVKEGKVPVEVFSRILDSFGPNIDRTIFSVFA